MNLAMQDLIILPKFRNKFVKIFVCLNFIFKPPHPNPLLTSGERGFDGLIFMINKKSERGMEGIFYF